MGVLLPFLPPVSPPAPQLSRRSCRSYQVMREPCRSGPRFKGGGRGFCASCAIRCVLIGHATGRPDPQSRRAGSLSAWGRRSSFALFALFRLAPSSGGGCSGEGVGLGVEQPPRHLRLLQPLPRPFGGVGTSREVGRPAITLRRSGGGRRRPASS